MIRILIVDDHDMVRSGLATFLLVQPDFQLIGEACCGEDAIVFCRSNEPDVILMDMVMPGMSGPQTIEAVRALRPQARIIGLTSFKEGDLVVEAMQAGAISFIYKNVTAEELAAAIRAAAVGQPTIAPDALQALIHAHNQPPRPGHDLTDREHEVLSLMVKGLNNVEIAESLVISRATVKAHVSNILSKLGVSGRTEAVALAVQHHIVGDGA